MPTTPKDAKGLLLSSIADPNPVLFLEHRWLHNVEDIVPIESHQVALGSANVARKGSDLTIVSSGYLTVEAIRAADYLQSIGIGADVIDLRTLSPLDWRTVIESVERTGRLLALDSAPLTGSLAEGLAGRVAKQAHRHLKSAPQVLAHPDAPEPTSYGLNMGFHVRAHDIARTAADLLEIEPKGLEDVLPIPNPHDVPGNWFKGPF